jgi:hypothetical protein
MKTGNAQMRFTRNNPHSINVNSQIQEFFHRVLHRFTNKVDYKTNNFRWFYLAMIFFTRFYLKICFCAVRIFF